jgi:hypothetical protein
LKFSMELKEYSRVMEEFQRIVESCDQEIKRREASAGLKRHRVDSMMIENEIIREKR